MNKLNESEVLNRFEKIHGNRYDYSKFIFTRVYDTSIIICKIHGEFEQSPRKHYIGRGCPSCGKNEIGNKLRLSIKELLFKFNKVHNERYDYSLIKEYKNNSIKVPIKCKIHGVFYQTSSSHLSGNGCPKCIGRGSWTLDRFQKESDLIHNFNFIIISSEIKEYGSGFKKMYFDIKCIFCGHRFWSTVGNHISKKQGCLGCKIGGRRIDQINFLKHNSTKANEPYKLYFLKFTHNITNEQFYKVGKTSKSINDRFRYSEYKNYNIEIISIIEGTHLWVAEQEDEFIIKFNEYLYEPEIKFSGHTECFRKEIYNKMFKEI